MSALHPDRAVREEMRQIRKRRDYPLWVKALARVAMVTVIWAVAAITLHIIVPAGNTMDFPVPATSAPHPATTGGHP